MAFKFKKTTSALASKGHLNRNLSFKNEEQESIPGTPILRKDLEGGILGEANKDGSIFLSKDLEPGGEKEKQVLAHEIVHMTDMKTGKLAYDDNSVTWKGIKYDREAGHIKYNGEWYVEGAKQLPWEVMPWE
tara:strand:+ start:54 stop:449 length:396 start_codon:yes stop_codon:yes gene_type:complete